MSCGQTNECLSITGKLRLESPWQPKTQQRHFDAITDGRCWRVRLYDPTPSTNSSILGEEYGTDGQSVYDVTLYDTNYTGPTLFAGTDGVIVTNVGRWKSKNNASVTVLPGNIPAPRGTLIEFVWLAYLSGCELKQREANSVSELPPLYGGPEEAHFVEYKEPARWLLSPKFPFSPSQLVFFGAGMYGFSTEMGVHRLVPRQAFTNLAFVVESRTNSGAWDVPAKFSFLGFRLLPELDKRKTSISFMVTGETMALALVPPPSSFLPAIPSSPAVLDWRLDSGKGTTYYVSNRWFSAEEVKKRSRR